MNYIFQIRERGLCSELNSLLGFYESIIDTDCHVYIDADQSQYFKTVSIYDVFKFPDIFVDTPQPDSKIIRSRQWSRAASTKYKTKLTKLQCSELFSYTNHFQNRLDKNIKQLSLPLNYNCFHIRRGDKVNEKLAHTSGAKRGESLRFEVADYIHAANSSSVDIDNLFIMTDDFKCIQELREFLLEHQDSYTIFSLVKRGQDGNSTLLDLRNKKKFSEQELVQFFAEMEIAKHSNTFVGTRTSNVYRYIMNTCTTNTKFVSLD